MGAFSIKETICFPDIQKTLIPNSNSFLKLDLDGIIRILKIKKKIKIIIIKKKAPGT